MRIPLLCALVFGAAASAQEATPPPRPPTVLEAAMQAEPALPRLSVWIGTTAATTAPGLGSMRAAAGVQAQAFRWTLRGELDVTDLVRPHLTLVRGEIGRWLGPFEVALGGWAKLQDCTRPGFDSKPRLMQSHGHAHCERMPWGALSASIAYGDPATMKRIELEAGLIAVPMVAVPLPTRLAVRWPVIANVAVGGELQLLPRPSLTAEVRYRLPVAQTAWEFALGGGLVVPPGSSEVPDPASGLVLQGTTEFQW